MQQKTSQTLRYPNCSPLSVFARMLTPKLWRLHKATTPPTLPSSPALLIQQLTAAGSSVLEPKSPEMPEGNVDQIKQSDLVDFAINTWRLEQRAESLDPEKFKRQRRQFEDSAVRFKNFLSRFEISFSDPKGLAYDSGRLDVEVISWDEAEDEESPEGVSGPWIQKTISPIIYRGEQIIRRGEVICIDPDS